MRPACRLGVVLLLSACTRPNLGFDGGEADDGRTTGGGSTVGDGPTTGTSTTIEATSGPDGGSVADTGVMSTGMTDTGVACEVALRDPYDIVTEPLLESVAGGCVPIVTLFVQNQGVSGKSVTGALCAPNCSCGKDPISLTFDGPLPESLPSCFELQVQLAEVEGECVVEAYRISSYMTIAPVVVGSNVETPMFAQPIALQVAAEPVDECNDGCTPASGYYELITAMGVAIPPNDTPVMVQVEALQYLVANEGSGVGTDCVPQVRWGALQVF